MCLQSFVPQSMRHAILDYVAQSMRKARIFQKEKSTPKPKLSTWELTYSEQRGDSLTRKLVLLDDRHIGVALRRSEEPQTSFRQWHVEDLIVEECWDADGWEAIELYQDRLTRSQRWKWRRGHGRTVQTMRKGRSSSRLSVLKKLEAAERGVVLEDLRWTLQAEDKSGP
jgi:hypothetical protein